MTQISRPFQIALAVGVVLLGVWLIALRGHSSSPSSSSSATSAGATSPAATRPSTSGSTSQSAPAGGTPASAPGAYHGSAPGVAGLTRAIEKARGAVRLSEQNAKQLQQKSAQASSVAPGSSSAASTAAAHASGAKAPGAASGASGAARSNGSEQAARAHDGGSAAANAQAKQPLVESELQHGRTVLVLFWNRNSSVDVTVRDELALLRAFLKHTAASPQDRDLAVHYSTAAEVGEYGTITHSLQIFQTPTLLVIAPNGKTKTLTGLVDAYTIRQAIKEARQR
jgi:hypothetical protein